MSTITVHFENLNFYTRRQCICGSYTEKETIVPVGDGWVLCYECLKLDEAEFKQRLLNNALELEHYAERVRKAAEKRWIRPTVEEYNQEIRRYEAAVNEG